MSPTRPGVNPSLEPAPRATAPVVVLCGFMGTGKTATGRLLAALLGVPFIDTDTLVEARAGKPVARIFLEDGEAHFRDLEAEACASVQTSTGAVIATGGGTLVREETFRGLKARGTLVWLDATLDAIAQRTSGPAHRPLLPTTSDGSIDRERLAALRNARTDVYRRIPWRLDTTHRTPEDVALEIDEHIRHEGAIVHLRADVRPVPGRDPRPGEARLCRIVVARGALGALGQWMREAGLTGPAFVLASRRVAGFHGARVRAALDGAGIANRFIEVDDAELSKSFDQAERLLYEMADAGLTRDGTVVALGGGVTGDVAGLVAALYMRGVTLVQVPTTLLAQVDSSIGGKVGVNHPRAKNLIGAIHQPHLVVADIDTLATLDARQVASGMAEVVKTAIIGSPSLFDTLTAAAGRGAPQLDASLLEAAVRECARVKARIVEEDPYERGPRRVLNLGHTLGHALEAAAGYGRLLHGEAVGIGMLAAIRVSIARGLASPAFLAVTRDTLAACGLPVTAPDVDTVSLVHAMGLDKKRRAQGLSFVLPVAPGDVRVVDDVSETEILATARE